MAESSQTGEDHTPKERARERKGGPRGGQKANCRSGRLGGLPPAWFAIRATRGACIRDCALERSNHAVGRVPSG